MEMYSLKHEAQLYSDVRTACFDKYEFQVNDYSTLLKWHLIEPAEGQKAGYYIPSELAYKFIKNELQLPSSFEEVAGKLLKWSDKNVYITDILAEKVLVHVELHDRII
jgi:hypothetical protein